MWTHSPSPRPTTEQPSAGPRDGAHLLVPRAGPTPAYEVHGFSFAREAKKRRARVACASAPTARRLRPHVTTNASAHASNTVLS